jgi:uncharacterized HAD superfamily protein
MEYKKKIGLDLDEVVVDYISGFLGFYNRKSHTSFKKGDFDFYGLQKTLGVSKEQAKKAIQEFESLPEFEDIRPIEGAIETICHLSEKADFHIITSRPRSLNEKTERFLKRYFGRMHFGISYSGDIYSEQGDKKSALCRKLGIPVLLEDSARYSLECANEGVKVLLFDRPWNKEVSHENLFRVFGWNEVPGILEKLNGDRK